MLRSIVVPQRWELRPPSICALRPFSLSRARSTSIAKRFAVSMTCGLALIPPEELRRAWKLKRDCTRRGCTTDEVLAELDHCQQDSERFIKPQGHLDTDAILRDTLPHPTCRRCLDDPETVSSSSGGSRARPRLLRVVERERRHRRRDRAVAQRHIHLSALAAQFAVDRGHGDLLVE